MNADARIAAVRRRLSAEGIAAIMLTDISNIRYVTGFENVFDDDANVACVITQELARIYTDSRYSQAVEAANSGGPWSLRVPKESVYIELCDELGSDGVDCLAFETSVPYGRFKFVSERFGGRVEPVDHWVEQVRQVKEAAEIERIAAAAQITDRAFDYIRTRIRPGLSEREIGLDLEIYMRSNGSDGLAFAPIVAGGPNSSRPHAQVTDRQIQDGDFLTLDFGARVGGYCSDMTRTVVVGAASDRQREVYAAVREANETAAAQVKAGLPGSQIDAVARGLLADRGFGEYFGHGLGHGVGLDVHELPSVGPRGRESVLAGSVITIEPGVYIPDFGGVRIEDLVLVEEGGYRLLSSSTRDLIEI